MKLDAMKQQADRGFKLAQVGPKLTAQKKSRMNSSRQSQIQDSYIRLTELIPELMDMVDEKKIA